MDNLKGKDGLCRVCGRSLTDYDSGAHDNCADIVYDAVPLNPDGTVDMEAIVQAELDSAEWFT